MRPSARTSLGIVVVAGLVAGCGDQARPRATPTPVRHLTANEICITPQPVACELIDSLPPDKRAALERNTLRYLHGRTPEQAIREDKARRAEDAARARAAEPETGSDGDSTVAAGDIGHLPIRSSGFQMANMWLATERLAGAKNSIGVWVGWATADPARGLVIRTADGDTVLKSTTGKSVLQQPLPIRGRGAHIKSVKNKTGILTIALADGRTVRYDGLHGRFVR